MQYDPADYPRFAVAVDIALFSIRDGAVHIALVRRGEPPFEGRWALPGGFVREDEDLDQAARRELAEETGLPGCDDCYVEQLGGYGEPDRDPRMRVVTVAYLAVCADVAVLRAGGDAAHAQMTPLGEIDSVALAFDHARIVGDALERVRSKLEYTTVATKFLPPVFTIGEVREVYEAVWDTRLHKGNFQRSFRRNVACFAPEESPAADRMDGVAYLRAASDRRGRLGRPAQQWWSLKASEGRDGGESVGLLEHALLAPREVWRRRLDHARGRQTFVRTLPEIRRVLRERRLGTFDAGFTELDHEGQQWAVWCVLSGEGAVRRETRESIALIASRLRDQGLASFQRLREDGWLYAAITDALGSRLTGEAGLEWPSSGPLRKVRAYRPVTEMDESDWCDCVIRALRDGYAKGMADSDHVVRDAFDIARDRYGIRASTGTPCENLTQAISERVEAALKRCIRDGYVGETWSEGQNYVTLECEYSEEARAPDSHM